MCGRFYVPEDASIQMIRAIVERLEHRNVKVKTGDVFPGDMAAVVASNRQLQPQPFAMEWGYHLSDGKRIINARRFSMIILAAGQKYRSAKCPVKPEWITNPAENRSITLCIMHRNEQKQ